MSCRIHGSTCSGDHPSTSIMRAQIDSARDELRMHVMPKDATEHAICSSLGETSWDECIEAIRKYRDH